MNYLFIHHNYPGQFQHLVQYFAAQPDNRVVFLSQPNDNRIEGVETIFYRPFRTANPAIHHYLSDLEQAVIWGQSVHEACRALKNSGFRPDIVVGHCGWGETLFVKDVWSDVPVLGYFEFFYHAEGVDVGFNPDEPATLNDPPRLRVKNAVNLMAFQSSDWGLTATRWQASLYPPEMRRRISAIHEGIDTGVASPGPASLRIAGVEAPLTKEDELITFVNRNLEPYRGFQVFMRALPDIQRLRPNARVLIVGQEGLSYGAAHGDGRTWRQVMTDEVGAQLDWSRVHFLGRIEYADFISLLRISAVHVYLTYPFVMGWSLLEALSCGCAVVASDVAPLREAIKDGQNGLLVDFFDRDGLCERIDRVLSHPDRMQKMRDAARKTILERYDLRSVTLPRQVALIQALIDGTDPRKAGRAA